MDFKTDVPNLPDTPPQGLLLNLDTGDAVVMDPSMFDWSDVPGGQDRNYDVFPRQYWPIVEPNTSGQYFFGFGTDIEPLIISQFKYSEWDDNADIPDMDTLEEIECKWNPTVQTTSIPPCAPMQLEVDGETWIGIEIEITEATPYVVIYAEWFLMYTQSVNGRDTSQRASYPIRLTSV